MKKWTQNEVLSSISKLGVRFGGSSWDDKIVPFSIICWMWVRKRRLSYIIYIKNSRIFSYRFGVILVKLGELFPEFLNSCVNFWTNCNPAWISSLFFYIDWNVVSKWPIRLSKSVDTLLPPRISKIQESFFKSWHFWKCSCSIVLRK